MTYSKLLPFLIAGLCLPLHSTVYADADDLDSELLSVEAAMADSEAAKAEAVETQKRVEEEYKQSKEFKAKADADIQKAKRDEEKARENIALNEKKILDAQEELERAKKEIEEAKEIQNKVKIDMAKSQADLEKAERERDHYIELTKQAVKEKQTTEDDLKKLVSKLDKVKKMEKAALIELTRSESDLRLTREKAKKSLEEGDKDSREYLRIIDGHRDAVKRIAKKLDEIEVEVEVNKAYDEKKERKEIAMQRSRTLASLKTGKFAKITSPACHIRSYPGATSKIIGAYKQGRKVHVKIHDQAWYTTVYKGEKVFMGAGCFE